MKLTHYRRLGTVALLGILLTSVDAQEKSKEELQKEALALNTVRSEEAIQKKADEIKEDKKHARKLVQAAAELLSKKEENTFTYSGAHLLGLTALEMRENKTAIEFLMIAVEKANKVKSIKKLCANRLLLIEAYLADNRPVDAEKIARKILSQPLNSADLEEEDQQTLFGTQFYASNELIRAVMQQGKFDDAQKLLDTLLKRVEADGFSAAGKNMVLGTKAQFLTYKGDLKDAIKVYELMIDETDKDERKERLREVIGNLEADAGNVDKAYEILSAQLKKKPDQAGINNDLGYILASHDRKLDEAERMIRKAVELEPENSSFLDSMAWVLYKQKKYKEAKEFMLKAVAQERGKNTELMEHLGDIQVALGQKDEAKKAYEAALAAMTFNHKDQVRKPEIEKKLKSMN
ncbi:MAG TPA: tetratricopeptide repeat protein [Gemmatales bacterium]|nr:tetratricopeptide repeat protein [Gemmatales bacterium]